jgi:hypothetical protein
MEDHVVALHQRQCSLVVEVRALATHLLVGLGTQHDRLFAAVAALLPSGHPPLGTLQGHLGHAEDAGIGDLAAIGQRGEALQAEIDARLLAREQQGLGGHSGTRDRHVPPSGCFGDRDRLGRARAGTGPVDAAAPDLREDQGAVLPPRAVAILREAERVVAVPALAAREPSLLAARHPPEERRIGLGEPGEHVLEDVAVHGGIGGERGANGLQFRFLSASCS